MIRTPTCEGFSDLYLRSTQWRDGAALFADEGERLSGPEALAASLRLAQAYAAHGAGEGDVVAFLCKSSARHAVAWAAAPLSGRVACNLHVRETGARLGETLAWLDARILVHDADLESEAAAAIHESGRTIARLSLGGRGGAAASYDDIVAGGAPFDVVGHRPKPGANAAIILSSGTTGRPKGIVHTQASLLETAKGGQLVFGPVTPHDATILFMQPSFAAWAVIMLPFLGGKAKTYFGQVFTPAGFLAAVAREKITMAPLVPTMWRMVFEASPGSYDLSSLKLATISGEPPAPSDIDKLKRLICPRITAPYLSSEAFTGSPVLAFTEDLSMPDKIGSSARPGVGTDVRILDPAGMAERPNGESGEISVSGPSLAKGYWKDSAETMRRFVDGWWRSGDLGRIDKDGYVWVEGRIDNIINSGGIKISGEEVEKAILAHPSVVQCAVIGQKDEKFGQRIEAYVVARQPAPGAGDIEAWLRAEGKLASFKIPKAFHFVEALPTGPTGKLYRRGLRGE
jgi:acyl-CoA synthetase (AMP-forming)/AMP-acid ligase II